MRHTGVCGGTASSSIILIKFRLWCLGIELILLLSSHFLDCKLSAATTGLQITRTLTGPEPVVLSCLCALGHRVEPVGPVGLWRVGDGGEVELWRVPTADAVVGAKVTGVFTKAIGRGSVPLGVHEHVVARLMAQPRDGPLYGNLALVEVGLEHLEGKVDGNEIIGFETDDILKDDS